MKKTIDKKKVSLLLIKIAVSVLVCVLAMVVPTAIISIKAPIEEKFSPKSDYQGVIEVWNIDTFEGGSGSKTSYLTTAALDYQSLNKGTYLLIKNMTPDECLLGLEQGQSPQLFSFGSGFAKAIKNQLVELSVDANIDGQILESSKKDDKLFAVGYAKSAYVLISCEDKLTDSASSISSQSFVCGNKKTLKNGKQKITYSLAFGSSVIKPDIAFENKFYPLVLGETTFDKNNFKKSAYDAYCDFVSGRANILLGTIRDVFRVQNRENQGKLSGAVYQPVGECSDLIQYFGVSRTANAGQVAACNKFINFVLGNNCQQKLKSVGLLSVLSNTNFYDSGVMSEIEKVTQNSEIQSIF